MINFDEKTGKNAKIAIKSKNKKKIAKLNFMIDIFYSAIIKYIL